MTEAGAAGPAEFAERMIHTLNEAGLALMVSVGHRTGLFDAMAAMPAATFGRSSQRPTIEKRPVNTSSTGGAAYIRKCQGDRSWR